MARIPGVWPRILDEGETRRLLDGLYQLEVAAEAWRVDAFPDLSRPRTIHAAACLDGGFRVTGLRGEPTHWVPWDKVELVAAGRIQAADQVHAVTPPGWVGALSTGFRAAIGRAPRTPRKARAFRIPPRPDRRGHPRPPRPPARLPGRREPDELRLPRRPPPPSAAENFPILVADLRRLAAGAYVTPPTDALLDPDGDPDDFEFESPRALLEDATLCLLWSWYRRDRERKQGEDAQGTGDHPLYPGPG